MRHLLGGLVSLMIGWPVMVWGASAVQVGVNIQVEYDEPTVTVNNTPLDDLDHTTIGVIYQGNVVEGRSVPATSPAGGGHITEVFAIPVQQNEKGTVQFDLHAVDLVGNVSPPNSLSLVVDKEPPGAPQ